MALRDVKQYLYTVQNQVLEMKSDLTDFDQALKDGYITEDRLAEVKKEIELIEINYQRLLYISYLLELPNRRSKQEKYKKANAKIDAYFKDVKADYDSIINENKSALDSLREQLKKVKTN